MHWSCGALAVSAENSKALTERDTEFSFVKLHVCNYAVPGKRAVPDSRGSLLADAA